MERPPNVIGHLRTSLRNLSNIFEFYLAHNVKVLGGNINEIFLSSHHTSHK